MLGGGKRWRVSRCFFGFDPEDIPFVMIRKIRRKYPVRFDFDFLPEDLMS